jgi:short-subunit dehydrogenase
MMKAVAKTQLKKVLITGCSSGFGRLLVTAFLENNYKVFATLRNASARTELFAAEISKFGDRLKILNFDVTSQDDLQEVSRYLEESENSELDCLINNAGFGVYGALEDLSQEQIQKQIDINVTGLILTTKELLKFLRPRHGHIINFSSVLGYCSLPMTSLYCGSKYAIEGFSESLYYELAPLGVAVSIVEPGAFKTEFKQNLIWGEKSAQKDSPYFLQTQNYKNFTEGALSAGDPKLVVDAIIKAAHAKRPPLRIRCGTDAKFVYLAKSLVPAPLFRWANLYAFSLFLNKK